MASVAGRARRRVAAKSADRHGAPPYFWFAEVATPAAGTWHATLSERRRRRLQRDHARDRRQCAQAGPVPHASGSVWQVRNSWNSATEDLFSAWIEKLFDAPPEQELSWKVWHEVLRDRSRNFLFNYLGRGEDKCDGRLRPDCADFVYFLRAYFAFKMGLPFGYSNCSRGMRRQAAEVLPVVRHRASRGDASGAAARAESPSAPAPPRRPAEARSVAELFRVPAPAERAPAASAGCSPPPPKPKRPANFGEYLRAVGDVVHTGAVRVSANDDNTDFYTVPLTQEALRPGTVYADPYGHVLMLVQRVPEANGTPGVFLAVDAEPDGSVTRKRFWRGNFLFVHEPSLGSPGFKHFRPIVRDKGGALRRLSNAEIAQKSELRRLFARTVADQRRGVSTIAWTTSCRPSRSIR